MTEEKTIDVNQLTARELLISLVKDMESVKKDIEMKSKADLDLQLRMAMLETKVKMYAAGGAALVTLLIKLMEYIL